MTSKIKSGFSAAVLVLASAFLINIPKSLAQDLSQTGNPQNMVGGGLQSTRADFQTAPDRQVLAETYQYDPSNSPNIKINLIEAAKNQPAGDQSTDQSPAKSFGWRLFGLSSLALLALFGLAKLLDRPKPNIFTR